MFIDKARKIKLEAKYKKNNNKLRWLVILSPNLTRLTTNCFSHTKTHGSYNNFHYTQYLFFTIIED